MAELERIYGSEVLSWFGTEYATIQTENFDFEQLGGSQKAGSVITEFDARSWRDVSQAIVDYYFKEWKTVEHKITLGISVYGWNIASRDIQKTGIILKKKLREHNVSLRLIPNEQSSLSTATSHHNKLGLSPNKVELLVVHDKGHVMIAESIGAQNITALAARDQARPHTDAFVGMLPPKLARMMVNMAIGNVGTIQRAFIDNHQTQKALPSRQSSTKIEVTGGRARLMGTMGGDGSEALNSIPAAKPSEEDVSSVADNNTSNLIVLDPFCGTGVVLQEALLLGYDAYGSDLSQKMVDYSTKNLDWLSEKTHLTGSYTVELGDAMTHQWLPPIDAIAAEGYLGQPFSAPPSTAKLVEVRGNCDHIISSFLSNLALQIAPGTPICLAVPAWNDGHDNFSHLPLVDKLGDYGFTRIKLQHVPTSALLYYRPGQVVARELLIMQKA